MKIDVVFVNPGNKKITFQNLGVDLAAVEPPFMIASIAAYLRNNDISVNIIDSNAENLTPEETAKKINEINPLLVCMIVYGGQPSASTQTMAIASKMCTIIKQNCSMPIVIAGLHPSALPQRTLEEEDVDYVIEGEEQIPLKRLIEVLKNNLSLDEVPGLWYYKNNMIVNNQKPKLIDNLDEYLPMAAWDLLPMEKYKAHNWHCFDNIDERQPYGAIYTSLGCPYKCSFCCINATFGKPSIRYRSPKLVVDEIEHLAKEYNVKNIKFIDEMFILNENHYMKITELLLEKNLDINIWCYARVDTVKKDFLPKMKKAGFNWFCLGIESASEFVRDGADKKLKYRDIKEVVKSIQDAKIRVLTNFIVGLPDDNEKTMQETLDMAIDLNTEFFNIYSAMAYPGSKLYDEAIEKGIKLPSNWGDYSQHAKNQLPLSTKYLSAMDVLKFRDKAWQEYFTSKKYLDMIEEKFGVKVVEHIKFMTSKKLERNYEN
ncbi:B12-binding domain-containing radical SAM protein [Malaciobacter mytili LMG 24559]|uniref:B12-binding domain-containing radical SAM protein n=1 Tax=Malaciobacter mytili LMG 24559 TaxID=1032238 RepID=A0AAX2AJN9_9BACT|nr:radical SAM protein [Malaciobacter mytili]AXH15818.1 B12-binding domain-containing radical SAM protein [Malaciobacter mytili LMG 24559]RXK16384.1 B12-binding domain-containing radical SAM protein [Malaciobacter mytili LMG 24559]